MQMAFNAMKKCPLVLKEMQIKMPLLSLFTFQIGDKNFKDCIYTFTALQEITFLKICLRKSQGTLKTLNRENESNFWNKRHENVSHSVVSNLLRSHGL